MFSLANAFSLAKKDDNKNTIPVLDGVRAVACLSVVWFHLNVLSIALHAWQPYPIANFLISAIAMQGGSGVTLFFILSGFLLFLPYARALLFTKEWPSARRFYLKRLLRIWPAYYVALFLMILLWNREYFQPQHLLDLGLFLTFFMDSSLSTFHQINGPFWTLAVEWQFYLLLPFLALLFSRFVRRGPSLTQHWWRLVACLGALALWGLFSRYWGLYLAAHPSQTLLIPRPVFNVVLFFLYGADGKFLEDFAVGMLLGAFYVLVKQNTAENTLQRWGEKAHNLRFWLLGVGVLELIVMTLWNGYTRYQPPIFPAFSDTIIYTYNWFSEFGLSIGYALCVMALLFGSSKLKRPFEWLPMRWIGMISYSLYIWHLPLLTYFTGLIKPLVVGWPSPFIYGLCLLFIVLIIIPFAYLSYRVIERSSIKFGERKLNKTQVQVKRAEVVKEPVLNEIK